MCVGHGVQGIESHLMNVVEVWSSRVFPEVSVELLQETSVGLDIHANVGPE